MLVSSPTQVLNRVVLLWIVSFYLWKDPVLIYSSVPVVMLGQSVQLPMVYAQDGANVVGLLAGVLAIAGLEDFVNLFAEDPLERLQAVVPTRLFAFFVFTAAAYFRIGPMGNAVAFTYGFVEVMLNFWLFLTVREESNEKNRVQIRESRGQGSAAGHEQDL